MSKEQTLGYTSSPGVCFSGDSNLSPAMCLEIVCSTSARSLASITRRELLDGLVLLSRRGKHEQSLTLSQKMKSSSLHLGKSQVSAHPACKRQVFPWVKHLWWPWVGSCPVLSHSVCRVLAENTAYWSPPKHTFGCTWKSEAAWVVHPCFPQRLCRPGQAECSQLWPSTRGQGQLRTPSLSSL